MPILIALAIAAATYGTTVLLGAAARLLGI